MTLRARLVLAMGALLALALIVSGAAVIGLTRTSLVADLDHDLLTARSEDVFPNLGPQRPADPTGRRFAALLFNANGELVQSLASGFAVAPDSLPDATVVGDAAVPIGTISERAALDGSLNYRVLALRSVEGPYLVLGAPLRAVDGTIAALIRTVALVSLAVLVLLVVIGWLLIRRNLRPLERMTATAEQITTGDLSQRVGVPDDGSEVGKLGQAFDGMLDQIESAFASQQQALRAKEASEQMLRQFVADASHELRTPLTTVRGYADLHRAGGLEQPAELEQAMDRIGSESKRMGLLVEDLLLLARLDQGRPLREDPVPLSTLVSDAVADFRAVDPGRPLSATLAEEVTVTGDEDRLRQLVGNLLANVRVHTPPHSPVEVALTSDDQSAVLAVADHGPGIEPAHVEHVFDRFYRADAGRTRDRGGSGLGLAIASSIAAAHGGSLEHSPTPGGGATFTLTLPSADSVSAVGPRAAAARFAATLHPGARSPLRLRRLFLGSMSDIEHDTNPETLARRFPTDFTWGFAASAYQIEGAASEDGRGPSIWDTFSHTPGKTANGDTGDVACDHYHRYRDDVRLMAELGARAYRFSISWPRVMPEGRGAVNQRGLDFYRRLVDELAAAGVEPTVNLFHWDLPQALEDRGGFANPEIVGRFADFAHLMATQLGDTVTDWMTFNEPAVYAFLGHADGIHAPGLTHWPTAIRVADNELRAHAAAVDAIKSEVAAALIGVAVDINHFAPATDSDRDVHAAAAYRATRDTWFLDPFFGRGYPQLGLEQHRAAGHLDGVELSDPPHRVLDYLGVNYYRQETVHANSDEPFDWAVRPRPGIELTEMEWEVVPTGLYDGLTWLQREYAPTEMVITENGAAYPDERRIGDEVQDDDRVSYLARHISAAADAIDAGVNLRGYFVWSLMDNFEWSLGYGKRFGVIAVDFADQRRTPKKSARWYQRLIAASPR